MRTPDFWSNPPEAPGLSARLLAPAGWALDWAGRVRRHLTRPLTMPVPVICIGNIVAGGAGKTPVVTALVQRLTARGLSPHVLTRGYGGRNKGPIQVDPVRHSADEVGDEPLLLAGYAPTWVAVDRRAGAQAAVAAGAQAIVMDDGFQNPALHKDLALLVIDADAGFGNGRRVPAGPLREAPARALERAEAVIVMSEQSASRVPPLPAHNRSMLHARLVPPPFPSDLRAHPVVAFAGIGRPAKFFATLREVGFDLVAAIPFPDHHPYSDKEIAMLRAAAAQRGALLMTTEKDMIRLPNRLRIDITAMPVFVAFADEAALDRLLDSLPALRAAA